MNYKSQNVSGCVTAHSLFTSVFSHCKNELEGGRKMAQTNCESCMNYEYDEEYDYYVCMKNLDEDEMYRFVRGEFR